MITLSLIGVCIGVIAAGLGLEAKYEYQCQCPACKAMRDAFEELRE